MQHVEQGSPCDSQQTPPEAPFFVVSPAKLGFMTFLTFGLYWWYCFYHNWRLHKLKTGEQISPFLRVTFGLFFIYPLLSRVDECIRGSGKTYPWSILGLTILYYSMMVPSILAAIYMEDYIRAMIVLELVLGLAWVYILIRMQRAINFSAGDPAGAANNRVSLVNRLWMLPGLFAEVSKLYLFVG